MKYNDKAYLSCFSGQNREEMLLYINRKVPVVTLLLVGIPLVFSTFYKTQKY